MRRRAPGEWARGIAPLERGLPGIGEIAIASLVLLVFGMALYGTHIVNGGFYYDDWANAAATRHSGDGSFGDAIDHFADFTSYRPVLIVYVPLTHEVLGLHFGWHIAWAVFLAVLMAASLFLLLRSLGLERIHAFLVAALVVAFPAADATRLWSTSSMASLSITLLLLGAVSGLAALTSDGSRKLLLHAASLALFLSSVLTYELGAPLILLAGLLYLWRGPKREALVRWAIDIAVIGLTLALVTAQHAQDSLGLSGMVDHAELILDQGLVVISQAALPFGTPRKETVLTLLVGVAIAGALVWRLLPAGDPARAELRRWLALAAAAVVATAAGWALLIPADPYYSPLTAGVGNRSNVVAALGIVLLVYSVAMVAGTLVFRGLPNSRAWAAGLVAVAALVIGFGYVDRTREDIRQWDAAFAEQQRIMGFVRAAIPDPPDDSVIYLFGHSPYYAPGIPILASSWDLNGRVKVDYRDATLDGYPQLEGTMACSPRLVYPTGAGYSRIQGARYGRAYFADVASGRVLEVSDRRECISARDEFAPGPFHVTGG